MAVAIGLEAITTSATRVEAIAIIRLEPIASRLEAIATGVEAIASRLEAAATLKLREVKKQGWQQFFWLLASRSAFWKLVFLADSSETKLPASKPYFLKRAASQKIKLLA